ncbi:MAG: HEPN domain-containing protein [Beggiatoa sp.]|nr:HEPN domain-containing protein [Beggiatoa sp.]
MNPNRRVPGSPDEWMDFAESDMRLARLAAGDTSIRREQVCFYAQQAAEKAMGEDLF